VAGTAGAHLRYISRPDAEPVILSQHMPDEYREARNWMDQQERAARKNARVIDKLRIALPRELTAEQRHDLVAGFMTELTGGRIPWYAAIHQTGEDELNPHVHIAIHDRDVDTGKRVLRLSDSARDREKARLPGPKAVDWIRERWEVACNEALAAARLEARIDRRSLDAQGIDREPTIHEGPRAQHINDNVKRPKSRERINGCGRVIDYPAIDQGRTRREFNAHIIDLNLEKAARSSNPATAIWAMFEKQQAALDARLEARLGKERCERTARERNVSLFYWARIRRVRAERNLKLRAAVKRVRRKYRPLRRKLQERQRRERRELKDKQSRLYIRIIAMLDFTGITRRRQEAARKMLSARHKAERSKFSARYHKAGHAVTALIKERYAGEIARQREKRGQYLAQLRERHRQEDAFADLERQKREREREQMHRLTQAKLEGWVRDNAANDGGKGRKTSGDFAKAILKAAKQEADRSDPKNRNIDRGLER
jgi:hypothetical protein